ncbi:MAG: hypothetical protein KGI57_10740, partial [Hyphomicrobiales bacterium]|nr:hypothetical protein [Hyphomicrobiales bacterium]
MRKPVGSGTVPQDPAPRQGRPGWFDGARWETRDRVGASAHEFVLRKENVSTTRSLDGIKPRRALASIS